MIARPAVILGRFAQPLRLPTGTLQTVPAESHRIPDCAGTPDARALA
jgi:hypothetical protein